MNVLKVLKVITALGLLGIATPSLSHHSFAMFDFSTELELSGTVETFKWANPHVWLTLSVVKDGRKEMWELEGVSTPQLIRVGWKSTTLKKGDKVLVSVRPLKNGDKGGQFVDVTLSDGTFLSGGGIPGRKGGKGVLTGLGKVPRGQPPADDSDAEPAATKPADETSRPRTP